MNISAETKLRILHEEEEKELKEHAKARKNDNFTQVYPLGFKRLLELSRKNNKALELYIFFAEHLDPSCGAVLCDQKFLADQFKKSIRTIRRWINFLEEEKALIKIPVSGNLMAYALNPSEIWRGYNTSKNYAAFTTRTLINKDGEFKRRIEAMFKTNNKEEK